MALNSSFRDRDYRKFVESPTRQDQSAVEVTVSSNTIGSDPLSVILAERVVINKFDEITSITSNSEFLIVSYLVPIGKKFLLSFCEASGENIATYTVKKNTDIIARQRTWFNGSMNVLFNFQSMNGKFSFNAGDTVFIYVEHNRIETANFDARIFGELIDE